MLLFCISLFILLHIMLDLNYFLRTCFCVISSRIYQKQCSLNDVTTIYGLCSFQDCDIYFKNMRIARLVREIDFSRYHFYERVGIYQRSRQLGIKSLQGSTMTVTFEPVPLFSLYKIKTKLIYWDERSLFFEHEVITLRDGRTRCLLMSRQYAVGSSKEMVDGLLSGLPESDNRPQCPPHIESWLKSMKKSSDTLKYVK